MSLQPLFSLQPYMIYLYQNTLNKLNDALVSVSSIKKSNLKYAFEGGLEFAYISCSNSRNFMPFLWYHNFVT